jgi:uncharacterized protein YcbK (DUF882 family)
MIGIGMGDISKNFSRAEFKCPCGCGGDTVDAELIKALEVIRMHFKASVTINSGFRCFAHNAHIQGASRSQHLTGRGADIVVAGVDPADVADYAEALELSGVGRYSGWTHVDTRSNGPARWGI